MSRIILLSANQLSRGLLLISRQCGPQPPRSNGLAWLRNNIHMQKRSVRSQPAPGAPKPNKDVENKTFIGKLFGKYLLLTNVISSGLLMVIGDTAAQEIEKYRSRNKPKDLHSSDISSAFDYGRMWCMFIVGAIMGVPHHYVYDWMDRIMPVQNLKNTINKILIDEFFMSPLCIFLFFYGAGFVEKKPLKETNEEVKSKFLTIYITDWIVWPGIQYVNFRYLPTKYRVLVVNVATALYNIFLSYMKYDYDNH